MQSETAMQGRNNIINHERLNKTDREDENKGLIVQAVIIYNGVNLTYLLSIVLNE